MPERLARVVNGLLGPLGVKVVRTGGPATIGGRRLSDADVIAEAARRGISTGAFVEELFGQPGRAARIVQRMISSGALSSGVSRVCEIGPGSGLYVEEVRRHAPAQHYEVYEIAPTRARHLQERFDVIARAADGETLQDTATGSMDLVHAHGVFVALDFLTACSYLREIARVLAPGGHAVFDIITADCLDAQTIDGWLRSSLRYASLHSRESVTSVADRHGLRLIDEFRVPLLVQGDSRYFVLRRDEP
jgi:predicted TPR repeat methyltransferase